MLPKLMTLVGEVGSHCGGREDGGVKQRASPGAVRGGQVSCVGG